MEILGRLLKAFGKKNDIPADLLKAGSVKEMALGSGGQNCDDSCLHRIKP